jgi:hypothetical protein
MGQKVKERLRVEQLLEATYRDWQVIGMRGAYQTNFAIASFTEVFSILRVGVEIGFLNREEVNTQFRQQSHRVLAFYDDFATRWAGVHEADVRAPLEGAIKGKPLADNARIYVCESLFPLYQAACVQLVKFNSYTAAKRICSAAIFFDINSWDELINERVTEKDTIAAYDSEDETLPLSQSTCLAGFLRSLEHMSRVVELLGPGSSTPHAPAQRRREISRALIRAHAWRLNLRTALIYNRLSCFVDVAADGLARSLRGGSAEKAALQSEFGRIFGLWDATLTSAGILARSEPGEQEHRKTLMAT